ncbi:MAG: hypothetical protein WAU57_07490, partial [Xanthobacteraceae bacterium]
MKNNLAGKGLSSNFKCRAPASSACDSHKVYYGTCSIFSGFYGLSETANVMPSKAGTTCTGNFPRS